MSEERSVFDNASAVQAEEITKIVESSNELRTQLQTTTDPIQLSQINGEIIKNTKDLLKKCLDITDPEKMKSNWIDNVNLSTPLSREFQTQLTKEQLNDMEYFTKKSKFSKLVYKNVDLIRGSRAMEVFGKSFDEMKTKYINKETGQFDNVKLNADSQTAMEQWLKENPGVWDKIKNGYGKLEEFAKKNSDGIFKFLKWAFKIGALIGLGYLAEKFIEGHILCPMAEKDSVCKVELNDGSVKTMRYQSSGDPNCTSACDYSYMCGSDCSDPTQPDQNHLNCCCSAAVDADRDVHAKNNATYSFYCHSAADEAGTLLSGAWTDFTNLLGGLGSNLEKIGMYLLIGLSILFGIIILFYILKFVLHYFELKLKEKEKTLT
jgi:hypothetical protein